MRPRLPQERSIGSTRPSGKLRLTNVSTISYEVPAMPDVDWLRTVVLEPGTTVVVPERVVAGRFSSHQILPTDSFEYGLQLRHLVVTEVPL